MTFANPDIGRAALRKATWRLIPILGAGYGIGLIDRTNLSFAALQMSRDLHFSSTVYGFGAGVFFLSYAGCNVPANLLLVRLGARRWLAIIMLAWSVFSAATIVVRTPASFYTLRFLLGVAEAGYFPGVIYYLTRWFPAGMRARAITRFYVFGPLSGVVMGSIAGALLNLQGRMGLAGWQWLFLIEALPAVFLGMVIYFFLADHPDGAGWLSPEERVWLLQSLERERNEPTDKQPSGLGRALRDRTVWLWGLAMFCVMVSFYSYVFFAPAIMTKLTGLNATGVGFIIAGQNLLSALAMVLNGIHSDRHNERFLHTIIPCALIAIGLWVGALARSPTIAIPALTIIPVCGWASQGPSWAACTTMLRSRSAAAGIGAITSLGILGGFVGPQLFGLAQDATGGYRAGLLICAVPGVLSVLLLLALARSAKASPYPESSHEY